MGIFSPHPLYHAPSLGRWSRCGVLATLAPPTNVPIYIHMAI